MANLQLFEEKLRDFLRKIIKEEFEDKEIGSELPDIPTEFTSTEIPSRSIPEIAFIKDTMFSTRDYIILHIFLSYEGYDKPILDIFGKPSVVNEFRKIVKKKYKEFLKENWQLLMV